MLSQQIDMRLTAADFSNWLAQRETPKSDWRIGTEHEKFLFHTDDFRPVAYEGEKGIGALLSQLMDTNHFTPMMEGDNIIGLKDGDGGSITLEPGGQFELSGAPLRTIHETCAETERHLNQMHVATKALDIGMLGVGFQPIWDRDDISWMPKGRYKIMRNYMPKQGNLGLDMMLRSCTVQVNLDYANEEDMRRKFRTSLALQPVATALFANSPFKNGKPSGLKSTRAHVWTDTDPDRCGVPECVFDDHFGYEQWVNYILDVPMYFLQRSNGYVDVAGHSFRDYMAGKLAGCEGQYPTMGDFEDHITTAFPEVRLKGYLEMRGADGGSWANICALPALWTGLLYDEQALAEAEHLASNISAQDVMAARHSAAKDALAGQIGGMPMHEVAQKLVKIAHGGLVRRGNVNAKGQDETLYLKSLQQMIETGKTNADIMLDAYHGAWNQDIRQIYTHHRY